MNHRTVRLSVTLLLALVYALLSPVLGNIVEEPDMPAKARGILPGIFCRHHHTSTCIHYTVTKTKTATKTATITHTVTRNTDSPAPTDACASVDPRCNSSGFTVDYYANPFIGYSYDHSGLGPGYYIDESLKPLGSSSTNTSYFPSEGIPTQNYNAVFPNSSFPDFAYFPGYTRDIDGITIDGNNFTLVYSGLYKAPSTGTFSFCTEADNENAVFFGARTGFPCGGKPSAKAVPSKVAGQGQGYDFLNPNICFSQDLVAGSYYPLRFVMGNYAGPSGFGLTVTPPGGTSSVDFTGLIYPPSCARKFG